MEINKFEEIKRRNQIKKMVSNARAILTNQIDFTEGCFKMKGFISNISFIKPIEEIDIGVFKQFYDKMSYYPVGNEKLNYNKEYLATLNVEIEEILQEFKPIIISKCSEIIETFK